MIFMVILFRLCTGASAAADFECTIIPGKLKQLDAGDGKVYGVGDDGAVYRLEDNNFIKITGRLIHVSVGPAGVWGVTDESTIFKFENNNWIVTTGGKLKQIDAGGNKFLGGVNVEDNIYCLDQSRTVSWSLALIFTPLGGSLKYYSCGPIGCWGVNSVNDIYYRYNVSPTSCKGSRWQQIQDKLAMVEVGTDGSVYGVNLAGKVYRREGITVDNPTGTSWTCLHFCSTFKHVSYDAGYLWLLSAGGDIYKCAEKKSENHNGIVL